MAPGDIQIALAILQFSALMLPFIALLYSALLPDPDIATLPVPETFLEKIADPRHILRFTVIAFIATVALAVGSIWTLQGLPITIKAGVVTLILGLSGTVILVEELIERRLKFVDKYHEELEN